MRDLSNGYEAVAPEFMRRRGRSEIGVAVVRSWTRSLPPGGTVLDVGCGHGLPVSRTLMEAGLTVYGLDASPSLIRAFRANFPHATAKCESVEDSDFFSRSFDGIIAIGLVFLLSAAAQRDFISRAATRLLPDGRFLFSCPTQRGSWTDVLTGQVSCSLGFDEYERLLSEVGLRVMAQMVDEGDNHYYDAGKTGGT